MEKKKKENKERKKWKNLTACRSFRETRNCWRQPNFNAIYPFLGFRVNPPRMTFIPATWWLPEKKKKKKGGKTRSTLTLRDIRAKRALSPSVCQVAGGESIWFSLEIEALITAHVCVACSAD